MMISLVGAATFFKKAFPHIKSQHVTIDFCCRCVQTNIIYAQFKEKNHRKYNKKKCVFY